MPKILEHGKRYAFIDVYNTMNTTEHILGFEIDWEKLYNFLKNKWRCEKIYFYAGLEFGDAETADLYDRLEKLGYEMKTKTMMLYKRRDKSFEFICSKCGNAEIQRIDMGRQKKSNCDVDMTLDIVFNSQPDNELMIFTGDGDFATVIKYATDNSSRVRIISNTCKKENQTKKRFSSKLRELFKIDSIDFININDWKEIIKKDVNKNATAF